jgi:predicted phosphodiesterase
VRILFLTDIHANLEGMEACLAAVPKCDMVVNLGDIVGYGGSPNEVTERSRAAGSLFVRGNHDKACTGITGVEEFNPIAGLAALWTRQTLTPENLEFLKAMPQGPIDLNGIWPEPPSPNDIVEHGKVQCVHGSPLNEDEYIIVMRDAYEPLMKTDAFITFFGHTHIQGGFCTHGDEWETLRPVYRTKKEMESCELAVMPGAKYLVNPGSAGQPRDGDWRAACASFDTETKRITFYRVPYDVQAAQKHIIAAKLPERLALRLNEGR